MNQKHKMGFNQQVTFPTELGLVAMDGKYYVTQDFYQGINSLVKSEQKHKIYLKNGTFTPKIASQAFLLKMDINLKKHTNFIIGVKDITIEYRRLSQTLIIKKLGENKVRIQKLISSTKKNNLNLQILADTFSVEVIANNISAFTLSACLSYYEGILLRISGNIETSNLSIQELFKIKRSP